jgi:hypothetical protein
MTTFFHALRLRNEPLFWFGLACLLASLACLLLIWRTQTQLLGINAWIKPFKFFVSSAIFVWSMAWYLHELGQIPQVKPYTWMVIGVLAFETLYIAFQAGRGQLSHFNISSPL